ncbi:hypothetical protein SAMN04488511_10915 [Pedobacter suwonensis]|uniref:Uncharacterized protein n=2 Tax=Pedobacter suwonensis TaxID=332999 RepID=A0A1I0TEL0_9SPHI|nr:hypothetical protein SAMN04488511_10915 [Pedobacter suwonensis]
MANGQIVANNAPNALNSMKKSLTLILISISIITVFSCKKKQIIVPEPTLPEISSSGLNTFGFMFAKEVWTQNLLVSTLSANYGMQGDGVKLNLLCRRKSPQNLKTSDTFNLKYTNPDVTLGTHELSDTNCKIEVETISADNRTREYALAGKGSITFIRWDLKNRIGSGTFSFTVKEITTGETVAITEGRFDMVLGN